MNGACLFLGILFLAAGIYFYSGKAVNHITAWKTMPEEEKRKIHIRPLCRNVGMMIATSGIIFLLSGAWYAFRKKRVFMVYGRLDGPIRRGCVLDRKIRPVPEFRKIAGSVPYGKGGGFMDAGPSRSRSSNRTRKTMNRFWGWLMLI